MQYGAVRIDVAEAVSYRCDHRLGAPGHRLDHSAQHGCAPPLEGRQPVLVAL